MNYLDLLANNREHGQDFAATAPKRHPSSASLTKHPKRAKLNGKRTSRVTGKRKARAKSSKDHPMAKRAKLRGKKKQAFLARMAKGRAKSKRRGKSGSAPKKRRAGKRKARKSGKRKSAKRVAAGRKAARTRKRKQAEHVKAGRKSARKVKRKAGKRKASSRRSAKRRTRKSGKRRSSRRRSSGRSSTRIVKQTIVKHVPAGGLLVKAPTRRRRRKGGKRKGSHKGTKRSYKRRSGGKRSRKGAMENPMSGTELFVGSVTGLLGFLSADAVDRLLATHALTDTGKKNAAGQEIYGDPQGATGSSYAGLYNATAICAPMNAYRWGAGLLMAAVPLTIAHFISAPTGRAALQFFGFAAGVRIVGKGLIDAVAMLARPTMMGQQLYDGEMRAAVLAANNGSMTAPGLSDLPQSGLGKTPALGAKGDCAPCVEKATGAGYPSMPREVTSPATQNQPPPAPPPPPPAALAPPANNPAPTFRTNNLTGVNGAPKRSRFTWGESNENNN